MLKPSLNLLSKAIAVALLTNSAYAEVKVPQHYPITVTAKAADKNLGQNIIYTLKIYDESKNLVSTGVFDTDNATPKTQGLDKTLKYTGGKTTPAGKYYAELTVQDGATTLVSPLKDFMIEKTDEWIFYLKENCYSSPNETNNAVAGGFDFYTTKVPLLNNMLTLAPNLSHNHIICKPAVGVTMPTENNLNNEFLTFVFQGANLTELNGLSGNPVFHKLVIKDTGITHLNNLSNLTSTKNGLDIRANPQLNDVTGLSNYATGKLWIEPDREYITKAPSDSVFCNNLKTKTVALQGTKQFQYNVCITPPEKQDELSMVKFFNDHCSKNYFYPDINFVNTDTFPIVCGIDKTANFAPIINTLPVSLTFGNGLLDANGLQSLTSVTGSLSLPNHKMTDLSDLSNLVSTTNGLNVSGSTTMTSLNGLQNLSSVGTGTLNINSAVNLTDVSALANFETGNIAAINKKSYTTKADYTSPFCSAITANPARITSVNSLMDFCTVPAELENQSAFINFINTYCNKNHKLPDVALFENDTAATNCVYTGSTANIPAEPVKTSASLNLSYSNIEDLNVFSNIKIFNGDLNLHQTKKLKNLNSLINLEKVSGSLFLGHTETYGAGENFTQYSLDGLDNLKEVGLLSIRGASTSWSGAKWGLYQLDDVYGIRNLQKGTIYMYDDAGERCFKKEFSVQAPNNSPLCENIKTNNVVLSGAAAYYNLCEHDPATQQGFYDTTQYYQRYCNVYNTTPGLGPIQTTVNGTICENNVANFTTTSPVITTLASNLILKGTKTSNIFENLQTVNGYVNLSSRSEVIDANEVKNLKSTTGKVYLNDMPNLQSLNGLQNYTGTLNLEAINNPMLEDVTAIGHVTDGNLYFSKDFSIKNEPTSNLCQAIFTGNVTMNTASGSWYGSVCNISPEQQDAYNVTTWFRDSCSQTSYYQYPSIEAVQNKTSHSCYLNPNNGRNMDFAPLIISLKSVVFSDILSVNDFGNSLSNLNSVSDLTFNLKNGGTLSNLDFISNIETVTGYINLAYSNYTLQNINGLSKLKTVGSMSLVNISNDLNDISPISNLQSATNLHIQRKDFGIKASSTSSLCLNIASMNLGDRSYASEDQICQPRVGYEGLFELAGKIKDGTIDPVYVTDFSKPKGWNDVIISNYYSKLSNSNYASIGDYFELTNTNGINLLKNVFKVDFNNSGMTKIPNALAYLETTSLFTISNESQLQDFSNISNLKSVSGNFDFIGNSSVNPEFSGLQNTGGDINISSDAIQTLKFNSLLSSKNISISGANINQISLPLLNAATSLNINAGNLSTLNILQSGVNIVNLKIENSKLTNTDFINSFSSSATMKLELPNNSLISNINALANRNYSTLGLIGLNENVDLYPLTNTVSTLLKLSDINYSKKIGFNGNPCLVNFKDSLNKNYYCYNKPEIIGAPFNISSNLQSESKGLVKILNTGSFYFDVPLNEDVSNRNNLIFTVNSKKDMGLVVQRFPNFIRITGNIESIENSYVAIYATENNQFGIGGSSPVKIHTVALWNGNENSSIETAFDIEGDPAGYVFSDAKLSFIAPGEYSVTPAINSIVRVKAWGAGGGSSSGGKGGYTEASVSMDAGTKYVIIVGGAGRTDGVAAFGGGGSTRIGYNAGGGGGLSGLFYETYQWDSSLLIAGGGGGGINGLIGGNGGGLSGTFGVDNGNSDKGAPGTQTEPGAARWGGYGYSEAGGKLFGGGYGLNTSYAGGAGGSGYYGGSGAGRNNGYGGSGGGGSGFIIESIKEFNNDEIITTYNAQYYGTQNNAPKETTGLTANNGAIVMYKEN